MDVGAVSFHDNTKIKDIRIEKDNAIVKAISKTKEVTNLLKEQLYSDVLGDRKGSQIWKNYSRSEPRNFGRKRRGRRLKN